MDFYIPFASNTHRNRIKSSFFSFLLFLHFERGEKNLTERTPGERSNDTNKAKARLKTNMNFALVNVHGWNKSQCQAMAENFPVQMVYILCARAIVEQQAKELT